MRRTSHGGGAQSVVRSPEEMLSQRFANGDIDGTKCAGRLETFRGTHDRG